MPTYQDADGRRYWFDEAPNPDEVRTDLVLVPDEAPPVGEPVPDVVSPWQVRKALNQMQLRDAVEAAVSTQPRDVRDGWEFATEFRRDNPLLNAMAPLLGIDLDAVFVLAATL